MQWCISIIPPTLEAEGREQIGDQPQQLSEILNNLVRPLSQNKKIRKYWEYSSVGKHPWAPSPILPNEQTESLVVTVGK